MNLASCELNAENRDAISVRCAHLALRAGQLIMDVRRIGPTLRKKSDDSPVCEADEGAEGLIISGLQRSFPGTMIVAEEAYTAGARPGAETRFFLIDALDGTAAFLAGEDGFTVNIALVDEGIPVVGVVYAPATGQIWLAGSQAFECMATSAKALPSKNKWRALHVRAAPAAGLKALVSLRYLEARSTEFLSGLDIAERLPSGSSIKFCQIASGEADIYPRFGPTMIWDAAAGHAILRGAGGFILDETGQEMSYLLPREDMHNPGFVAFGDSSLAPRLREVLATLS